jgi:hypothetical protein
MSQSLPEPSVLWAEAQKVCNCHAAERGISVRHTESCPAPAAYLSLMEQNGLLRRRRPGEPVPGPDDPLLPCGITPRRLRANHSHANDPSLDDPDDHAS